MRKFKPKYMWGDRPKIHESVKKYRNATIMMIWPIKKVSMQEFEKLYPKRKIRKVIDKPNFVLYEDPRSDK